MVPAKPLYCRAAMIAFDAIHDQAWPRRVLAVMHGALKPGGVFLMADIAG
jgi:predicted methyltransferase